MNNFVLFDATKYKRFPVMTYYIYLQTKQLFFRGPVLLAAGDTVIKLHT